MRRARTSTWILTAVFLITLVAYLLVRPPPAATTGVTPATTPSPSSAPATSPPAQANRADQADDHTETNRRGKATEFGVPCRNAPDPGSGGIVLSRGHASSLSHRHSVPLG